MKKGGKKMEKGEGGGGKGGLKEGEGGVKAGKSVEGGGLEKERKEVEGRKRVGGREEKICRANDLSVL